MSHQQDAILRTSRDEKSPPREENFSRGGTVTGETPTGRHTARYLSYLPPREEKFSRGDTVTGGGSPMGRPTVRCLPCLPPREEKLFQRRHSHRGVAKRTPYYALPALPASIVNGLLCLIIVSLSRGESPTGRRTTC